MTVLLDSHVVHWWSAEPTRVGARAAEAIREADTLAIADISWFELAWLAHNHRIVVAGPIDTWLQGLSSQLQTVPVTASTAARAVRLPTSFPGDPADRLIFATAAEHGWPLISKDEAMRAHRVPGVEIVW